MQKPGFVVIRLKPERLLGAGEGLIEMVTGGENFGRSLIDARRVRLLLKQRRNCFLRAGEQACAEEVLREVSLVVARGVRLEFFPKRNRGGRPPALAFVVRSCANGRRLLRF